MIVEGLIGVLSTFCPVCKCQRNAYFDGSIIDGRLACYTCVCCNYTIKIPYKEK